MDTVEQETKEAVDIRESAAQTGRYTSMPRMRASSLGMRILGVLAGIALLIGIVLGIMNIVPQNTLPGLQTKKYQAAFLTNGQVYFGKLRQSGKDAVKITDIYYLQTQTQPAGSAAKPADQTNNVQLIKLGSEIHGPSDLMVIPRSQLLFWENLKSDGKVAAAIAQYKAQPPATPAK